MSVVTFSEWITQKYVEWRGNAIGREKTIKDFAEWVGVSQSLMSQWMNPKGKKPTSASSINALANRFGMEVYDVLGLAQPNDIDPEDQRVLNEIAELLKKIPREKHGGLVFAVRAWAAQNGYIIVDLDK